MRFPINPTQFRLIASWLDEFDDLLGHSGAEVQNDCRKMADVLEKLNALPKIVCLVGSGRFSLQFAAEAARLTLEGYIVLMPYWTRVERQPDDLHLRKIDLADEVRVVNVGGYVGSSTAAEIAYAISRSKPLTWVEPTMVEGVLRDVLTAIETEVGPL